MTTPPFSTDQPSDQPANQPNHIHLPENEFSPNAFLGMGVNPIQLDQEIHQIVNGPGGTLDQMYLYVSPAGAAAWLQETTLEGYKNQTAIPVEEVADGILRRIRKLMPEQKHLNLISFGSGDAYQEQRLIQALLRKNILQHIDLYLVDASFPLLSVGFERCKSAFALYPQVNTLAVHQNFYTLPQNQKFIDYFKQSNEVTLVTMLGGTFWNLEREISFLRDTFGIFSAKTLFLTENILPSANPNNLAEIKQKEPWLSGQIPAWGRFAQNRWAVPFLEHHPQAKTIHDIHFLALLHNRTRQIEDSYVIEIQALVQQKLFTIQRFKRCSVQGASEAFRAKGWNLVNTYPFYNNKRVATLFQKE